MSKTPRETLRSFCHFVVVVFLVFVFFLFFLLWLPSLVVVVVIIIFRTYRRLSSEDETGVKTTPNQYPEVNHFLSHNFSVAAATMCGGSRSASNTFIIWYIRKYVGDATQQMQSNTSAMYERKTRLNGIAKTRRLLGERERKTVSFEAAEIEELSYRACVCVTMWKLLTKWVQFRQLFVYFVCANDLNCISKANGFNTDPCCRIKRAPAR